MTMSRIQHEVAEEPFPRHLLEGEGYIIITHLLADAIEAWGDDENDNEMRSFAARLRELARSFE